MNERDYDSPEYKAFRYAVLARDNWTCQLTNRRGGTLEVHHIIPWSKAPRLRFVVSNGITLSKEAHEMVTGHESDYEDRFKRLVSQNSLKQRMSVRSKTGKKKKFSKQKSLRKKKWRIKDPRDRY